MEKKLKRRRRKRKDSQDVKFEDAEEVTPKEENGDVKPNSHLESLEGLSKMVIFCAYIFVLLAISFIDEDKTLCG